MYTLLGMTKESVRVMKTSRDLDFLRDWGNDLRHYAIYREYVGSDRFHNATAAAFLVEHNNDPFWLAKAKSAK